MQWWLWVFILWGVAVAGYFLIRQIRKNESFLATYQFCEGRETVYKVTALLVTLFKVKKYVTLEDLENSTGLSYNVLRKLANAAEQKGNRYWPRKSTLEPLLTATPNFEDFYYQHDAPLNFAEAPTEHAKTQFSAKELLHILQVAVRRLISG